ncbi:hypothetical protein ABT168_19505 [Streptomyces sp. NPDC001793]|uniref:hypothetical protein n=1 Tax=Streptomyces sp. NPDC001793 TaxID=3154657 RepID=UPI00332B9C2A
MEEVAALVDLLKRTGEDPNPGDEALRVAATTRPVSEVGPLLALLGEAPHTAEASYEALRAAAVERSVDEVVELIKLFDRAKAGQLPTGAPSDGDGYSDGHPDTAGLGTTALPSLSDPFAEPYPDPYGHQGPDLAYPGQGPGGAPAHGDPAMRDAPPRPPRAPWPGAGAAPGGPDWQGPGAPSPGQAVGGVLRSVLRWPAAVALALCGLGHLPVGTAVTHNPSSDAISLIIAVVYLLLAGCLAMRDTAAIWTASAAAAVTVIVLHALSRAGVLVPLRSSLGDASMWPELLAVGLAILSAGLAGAALLLRPRRVSPAPAGA